jgi:hypothetical protein
MFPQEYNATIVMGKGRKEELLKGLGTCVIFSRLPPEALDRIAAGGSENRILQGEIQSIGFKRLGFLNVVLSGRARVEYSGASLYGGAHDLPEGRFFGSIDTVLGIGKFLRVTALSDCSLFSIHRNDVRRLLNDLPELKNQLSHMRLSIAVREAESQQKRASVAQSSETGQVPRNRIAPRFSVWERNMGIQLAQGETRKVENLSSSGLYVAGKPPVPAGTEFSFMFQPDNPSLPTIPLTGGITRVDAAGFGVSLAHMSKAERLQWEDVVVQAMSLEITERFQPELSKLEPSLSADMRSGATAKSCEILGLGTEGAVVRTSQGVPQGEFILAANLTPAGGTPAAIRVRSKAAEVRSNRVLIQFLSPTAEEEDRIRRFLDAKNQKAPPSPTTAEPLASKGVRPETIEVKDPQDLNTLFIREITNNVLILYSNLRHNEGESVAIRLKLLFSPPATLPDRREFDFSGSVLRINHGDAVVELDPDCIPTIGTLRRILSASNHRSLEKDLDQQIAVEHNTEHRRYVQLSLVVLLLLACGWWCYDMLLS